MFVYYKEQCILLLPTMLNLYGFYPLFKCVKQVYLIPIGQNMLVHSSLTAMISRSGRAGQSAHRMLLGHPRAPPGEQA